MYLSSQIKVSSFVLTVVKKEDATLATVLFEEIPK